MKTRVFISWSQERSKALAEALAWWLQRVLQGVDPWFSPHSIESGARWSLEMAKALEGTSVGIACLTRENLKDEWINFEAGALTKSVAEGRLCTYLLDIRPADIQPPLGQFQHSIADRAGTFHIVKTINGATATPLGEAALVETFDKWWPDLEAKIKVIPPAPAAAPAARKQEEILEEVLSAVRGLQQRDETFQRWLADEMKWRTLRRSFAMHAEPQLRSLLGSDLRYYEPDAPADGLRILEEVAGVRAPKGWRFIQSERHGQPGEIRLVREAEPGKPFEDDPNKAS